VLVATEEQDCRDAPDPVGARALSAGEQLLLDAYTGHVAAVTGSHRER
jgi:hypothetical protein